MIISAFLLLGFLVHADEKPECTYRVIADNCEFFKKNQDKAFIELPDGTTYPNPFHTIDKKLEDVQKNLTEGTSDNKQMSASYDQMYEDQSAILELLEGSSIPMRERLNVVSAIMYSGYASADPAVQEAEKAKLLAKVEKAIGEEKYKKMTEVAESIGKNMAVQQQAINARKMEVEIKEREEQARKAGSLAQKNKRQKRIKELFDYAQETVIEVIKKGRSDADLSAEEKILVEKIKLIKLNDLNDSDVASSTECVNMKTPAYYSGDFAKVSVCPDYLNYPDVSMLRTMGHEFAHAIDPCYATHSHWTVDKEKLENSDVSAPVVAHLSKQSSFNIDPFFTFSDEASIEKLIENKTLIKTMDGIPPSKYPFQNEYNCMVNKLDFRDIKPQHIEHTKNILGGITGKPTTPEGEKQKARSLERMKEAYEKYPGCMQVATHASHTNEAMCDVFGSLVVEKYLAKNPLKNETDKAVSHTFIGSICKEQNAVMHSSLSPAVLNNGLWDRLRAEHPDAEDRVNKIYLNLPGMEEAYGCKRKIHPCFDHLSLAKRNQSASQSESGVK